MDDVDEIGVLYARFRDLLHEEPSTLVALLAHRRRAALAGERAATGQPGRRHLSSEVRELSRRPGSRLALGAMRDDSVAK